MKILVICQHYYPEPFRISDICEELVRRGHEVTVVTGVPNYPEGITYRGYEKRRRRRETVNGVNVHRCFTIPRKTGTFCRVLNYYSYAISSSLYVRKLPGDFDVVLVNQLSPIMMVQAGIIYAKKNKVPLIMYCLDIWPESLIAGGIQRGSQVYRLFHRTSRKLYTRMDRILVSSRLFTDYLSGEFGIPQDRISWLPQYAEGIFDRVCPKPAGEIIDLTLAGNIGEIQSVETVLKAAAILKDAPVRFHIVGGGTDLERLRKLAKEMHLDNVTFHGRRPLEEMSVFYQNADAMLVTMKADPVLSITLPGKVQSYMAAGKPIIGAIDGETAEVIREADCGFCAGAEDANALAANIMRFVASDEKLRMGKNARAYYEANFDKHRFMDTLEDELMHVRGLPV